MKTNLTNWLCGFCALLLLAVLVFQFQQQGRLDTLQQQQAGYVSAMSQQQQELRDAAAKLASQVTNLGVGLESRLAQGEQQGAGAFAKLSDKILTLGTNWETELTPRLNAKSDEVVTAFSVRLNQKATEAATQVASSIRLQAEAALNANAVERSNKVIRLIEAASRYEKANRPELTELCYLSALKCSDGNVGLVLKPFMGWKERSVEAMTENEWLTKGPATLLALYETLDKVLPDSSSSPEDMENALAATDRIRERIVERQQAKMKQLRRDLSWDRFDVAGMAGYQESRVVLAAFSPANQMLEKEKVELQEVAENLIQTASATASFSTTDIFPPSPKASVPALTNWFERGLAFISSPTNTLEARLGAISVLTDFAQTPIEIPEIKRYAETLTNESIKLSCAQWQERVTKYASLLDQKDKPDADMLAVGQSLLSQGLAIIKSFTNKTLTADVGTALPGLASKLYLQRELLLVNQMELARAPEAFVSKEQAARARSLMYGQIVSTVLDVRAVENEIVKEASPASSALVTLKDIQKRFGEYLTAYDKFDKVDFLEAKAAELAKRDQQRRRFADYCKQKIEDAESLYEDAKDRASGVRTYTDEPELIAKWTNVMPQKRLKEGFEELYSIDISDLNRADHGASEEWLRVNKLLTTRFEGTPSSIDARTRKKSLNDF